MPTTESVLSDSSLLSDKNTPPHHLSIVHFDLQSSLNCHYSLVKWVGEVFIFLILLMQKGSQVALMLKNLPANTGDIRDVGSIPLPALEGRVLTTGPPGKPPKHFNNTEENNEWLWSVL